MTPRQILLNKFKTQTAIADAAGCTRQAISIAFKRGQLSYQIAALLARRMRTPVSTLLVGWVPDTNRKKQSPYTKKRLAVVAEKQT